ncbi:MAG TPA: hypothetical protein VII82_06215 [Polyangiaceae bacterium]
MSVFSKLFSGSPKGETEATSTKTAEEDPSMQRPPNEGRGAGTPQQPNTQSQKASSPSAKSAQPRNPAAQATPSKGNVSPAQPASSAAKGAPAAPAPAVIVTRSIDIGASPTGKQRPAMPAISIGPPTTAAAAPAKAGATPSAAPPAEARASVRPTAPDMMTTPPSNGQASIADTFERLLSSEDLDAGFASIEKPATSTGAQGSNGAFEMTDLAEVRLLFAQLAANHVRQVRDFMIDLRWSEPTTDWLPICEPALRSLRRAADKLELTDLCEALDRFSATLAEVLTTGAKTIAGPSREGLLARYEELSRLMPQAFALDLDRTQREAAILQSLLLQVPEVKKVTLDRMYAAGLTTLEAMFLANPGDIAATTGIAEPLARQIVDRFRAYREQVKATVPDATRARDREHIAELTARLRRENDDYEQAAASWTREASEQKKELRKAREQTLLDIQVALARLGEVQRLSQLERLPFEKKLAHLEAFLEEARDKYVAQS